MSYILLFVSALFLGIANLVFPRASKALGAANTTLYYYICATGLALLYWIPAHENIHLKSIDWRWTVLIAVSMLISNLAYCYGAEHFDTALPAVIRALSFFATAFIAVYVDHGPALTLKDWIGLALVALGIIIFSFHRSQ